MARVAPAAIVLARNNHDQFSDAHVAAILRFGSDHPAHGIPEMPAWGPILGSMDKGNAQLRMLRVTNLCNCLSTAQQKWRLARAGGVWPGTHSMTKPRSPRKPAPPTAAAQPTAEPSAKPGARISRRAADRLRAGHLWVYASDIESLETGPSEHPALLPVADSRGILLGTALFSHSSQIALRLVARTALDEPAWLALFQSRLRAAIARRRPMLNAETDSCRLVFSEADELPGLIIDKYAGLIIVQRLTRGLLTPSIAESLVRVLRDELTNEFAPDSIIERPDPRMRELEGLAAPDLAPLWSADANNPVTQTRFRLNGLVFHYDANAGQKTGAFLDQRDNYAAACSWAQRLNATARALNGRVLDHVLDVCCYQGGFALHFARIAASVTGVDSSRASLEVAEKNLAANRDTLQASIEWIEADAFTLLRDWSDSNQHFDAIILDPPAFAKSKRAVEGALRGYKELNLRALRMLRPGGLLVTCSCSHHVGWHDLEAAVASAAADAHRRVRLLERRGAALDHPVILNQPETEYLKCLILEVE
ncbi:MAG TPA: class I SAM-dependent rRNA methyltransferase [Terracidiphilus sp.]|nr:class I SAM-dependent rRNA methyltransferase [Terracidiphilus sp.]